MEGWGEKAAVAGIVSDETDIWLSLWRLEGGLTFQGGPVCEGWSLLEPWTT